MGSSSLVWDWHLHCPVLVSNTVLRTLIPEESLDVDKARVASVKSAYHLKEYDAIVTGGIVAGLNFPPVQQTKDNKLIHDDDIHVLLVSAQSICQPGTNDPTAFAEIEESNFGLIKIRIKDPTLVHPSLIIHQDGAAYLCANAFREVIPDIRTGDHSPFPKVEVQNIQNRNVVTPAWTHSWAFRCSQWPEVACEWLKQQHTRGFITKEVIEEVNREGCHLVPAKLNNNCVTGPDKGTLWTYCFANAETKLLNSLSPLQKHVFVLLKIICFQNMSNPRVIQMSHLRALFFRVCKKVPEAMWRPDQLTQLLMYTLDELLHTLIDNKLPNPFIKELNLFDGMSCDFLDEMQAVVADVRQNALSVLLEFCQKFRFSWMPKIDLTVSEPLRNVVDKGLTLKSSGECIINVLLPFLIRFTRAKCGSDEKIDSQEAMEALRGFHRMVDQLLMEAKLQPGDIFWLVASAEHQKDLSWQMRMREYIVEHVACQNMYAFKGNLACYYHIAFRLGQAEYRSKAKEMFQSALAEPNASAATKMDYAVFLFKTEDWKLAQSLLFEIIATESSENANSYDAMEIVTLESGLQELGQALGEINKIPAIAHAFYLLLASYNITNNQDLLKINAVLQKFSAWCEKSDSTDYVSYTLLALAFEKWKRYDEAIAAYVTALMRAREEETFSTWASTKLSLCQNLGEVSKSEANEGSTVPEEHETLEEEKHSLKSEGKGPKSVAQEEIQEPLEGDPEPSNELDNYDEQLQQAIAMSLKLS